MAEAARDGRKMGMERVAMVMECTVLFSRETGRHGIRELDCPFNVYCLTYIRWDAAARLGVVSDLYAGVGACGVFRMAQGWLSMSNIKGGEGHLLVNPILKGAIAYLLLRPFFQAKKPISALTTDQYLDPSNWVLEPETTVSFLIFRCNSP